MDIVNEVTCDRMRHLQENRQYLVLTLKAKFAHGGPAMGQSHGEKLGQNLDLLLPIGTKRGNNILTFFKN